MSRAEPLGDARRDSPGAAVGLLRGFQGGAPVDELTEKGEPPVVAPAVVRSWSGKWQVNKLAEWCPYHIKCTGDPNWLTKAMEEVKRLNSTETPAQRKVAKKTTAKEEQGTLQI